MQKYTWLEIVTLVDRTLPVVLDCLEEVELEPLLFVVVDSFAVVVDADVFDDDP